MRLHHVTLAGVESFDLALHDDVSDRFISAEIARTGAWEPFETALVRCLLPHYHEFIDIGANIGWYTVIAGLLLKGRGKAHAFEPAPHHFRMQEYNVRTNALENTQTHQAAVGNLVGTTTLFFASDNQGDHSVHASGEARASAEVSSITLDAYFQTTPSRCFLPKSDTQGAEPAILAGARQLLRHDEGISSFLLDFWPFGVAASGWAVAAYLDAIEGFGRDPFVLDETSGCLSRSSVVGLAGAAKGDLRPEGRAFRNIALLPPR